MLDCLDKNSSRGSEHRVTMRHHGIGFVVARSPRCGLDAEKTCWAPFDREWSCCVQFGRTFEEFEVGAVYRHQPGRTLTESDNQLFSLLTMNHHPVHLDAAWSAEAHHQQRLVVGTLVFSVAVGLSVPDISGQAIANLGYELIDHVGPVFVGDTIYAESTVLEIRESATKPDRGVVRVETRAWNQHGDIVLTFRRSVLIPKRAAARSLTVDPAPRGH
jgi:acyl dehydratase